MTKSLLEKFTRFAYKECEGSSELYKFLALKIVEDKEILELASQTPAGQPVPNLLFGAVHYLLFKGTEHELSYFYPSLLENPKEAKDSFQPFKDFCFQHFEEISKILKSKIVQTNEVRRCAYLYPAISSIYQRTNKPLALIEIGTSAGLQLYMDQYSYDSGNEQIYGVKGSEIHITSEAKGGIFPAIGAVIPVVATRIGIDLHINDVSNEEDFLWLKSLIWPEHHERRELFENAARYVSDKSLKLIEGDGVALLHELVDDIPEEQQICVFHTHVANQMPVETRSDLLNQIERIGMHRDVFHLYNNIHDGYLHLDYYLNGKESLNTIAETEGHGRWFIWKLSSL